LKFEFIKNVLNLYTHYRVLLNVLKHRFYIVIAYRGIQILFSCGVLYADFISNNITGRDPLLMSYFNNLDNGYLNKYEKNIKIEKSFYIRSITYRLIVIQI
jgi:hypothetical protein